jgi:hypothetical protein
VKQVFEMRNDVIAVVQKIVSKGKHGAFVVAKADKLEGSITFSLESTVWQEQSYPEAGEMVYLTNLRKKRAGWRAKKGRYYNPSDEQIENRKEQDMLKKAKAFIEGVRGKWFPTDDDKVWKQWVDYKRRETRDLAGLLTSDVRDSFKRRAIFLLLVPSAELNSIYWTEGVGKFYQGLDFLKTLTPDLLGYATDLIIEFYTMLKPMHCERPKQFAQGGRGITIFMSVPDKYHDALLFYNNSVLLLLTLLPEKRCEQVFILFSLRDISTYANMDDSSGYNPFQNLLYSKVEERWKRQADATMRQIIRDELEGKTNPREEWEGALQFYASTIELQLYGEKMSYGIDLFADQIQFLVSKEHYGHGLINPWKIPRIYQILSADIYKEIRYRVASFVIFGNKNEFTVWSEDTLQIAGMMLNEFGQDDQELAQRIQLAIDEGKKRLVERQNEQVVAKQTEDDIMNQMK